VTQSGFISFAAVLYVYGLIGVWTVLCHYALNSERNLVHGIQDRSQKRFKGSQEAFLQEAGSQRHLHGKQTRLLSIYSSTHYPWIQQLSLFTADAIQGLGAIVNIEWLRLQRVEKGNFCTTQGVIQQLGETTVAVATCVSSLPPSSHLPSLNLP